MSIRKNVKVNDPWDPMLLEKSDRDFDTFMDSVRSRFDWGQRMHGDRTAEYTLYELLCEAQEEILDAPVWLSFLHKRLEELKVKVVRIIHEYEKLKQNTKAHGQAGCGFPSDQEDAGRKGCPIPETEGDDVPSGGPGPESCVGYGRKEKESSGEDTDVSWDNLLRELADAVMNPYPDRGPGFGKVLWDLAGRATTRHDK